MYSEADCVALEKKWSASARSSDCIIASEMRGHPGKKTSMRSTQNDFKINSMFGADRKSLLVSGLQRNRLVAEKMDAIPTFYTF